MKLYLHPRSTTSRAVLMFVAEHHMNVETECVDIFAGAQFEPAFVALNPDHAVPVLTDGDLVLPECSAILKHLAETLESPTYPADPAGRARVNAAMDWFNTGFARDFAYGVVYPTVYAELYALPEPAQTLAVARAVERTRERLAVLERRLSQDGPFVCGDGPTIGDYLGGAYVSLTDLVDFDLAPWPHAAAWMRRLRARPGLAAHFAEHDAYAALVRERLAQAAAA